MITMFIAGISYNGRICEMSSWAHCPVMEGCEVVMIFMVVLQMNCAHLENKLHEAREESRTNLCAADRRAAEYSALRTSSVRLRGLMERLRSCITAPASNPNSFVESLRNLAASLSRWVCAS